MNPTYDAAELKLRLQRPADDLKALLIKLPDHDAITDVFDYVVGAFYGLMRAIEVGFMDRPGSWHKTYRPHLPQYVEHIASNRPLNDLWLAGFYFNSGMQRLAACFDRIPKLLGASGSNARERMKNINTVSYAAWDKVYAEINAFKHKVAGKAAGRTVSLTEAVQAFEEVITLLRASETQLAATYCRNELGP